MPKFVKLLLKGSTGTENEIQWRIAIDNLQDLKEYTDYNAEANAYALLNRPMVPNVQAGHYGSTRAETVSRVIDETVKSTPAGEKVNPLLVVAGMTDRKHLAMFKYINSGGTVAVNEVGGWCGLDNFLKI